MNVLRIKLKFSCCVVLGALAFLAGCGSLTSSTPAAPPLPPPPTSVTAAVVETRDIPIYLDEIGKCASPEIVSVLPQVSGKIVKIHFADGSDIKKDAPLFTIDPEPYAATLAQAQAELETNQAALAQARTVVPQYEAQMNEMKADLEQFQTKQVWNENELERAKDLLSRNATSKADFDAKQVAVQAGKDQLRSSQAAVSRVNAQVQQSRAAITVAEAKIKSALAAIKSAAINLSYCTITSPVEGRAGQRLVDPGNVVTTGMDKPLIVIQKIDPLYVDFTVPENELTRVRASLAAQKLKIECRIPERSGQPRGGKVFFLDSSVQEGNGVIKLRAEIDNKDRFFWPGQFVDVRLILEMKTAATLIPTEAIQLGQPLKPGQSGHFVFVVKPDATVEQRALTLGQRHGQDTAVIEGLAAGEKVVLTGQLMLFPGAKVEVAKETPPAPPGADAAKPKEAAANSEAK